MVPKIMNVFLITIIGITFIFVVDNTLKSQYPSTPITQEGYNIETLGLTGTPMSVSNDFAYIVNATTDELEIYNVNNTTLVNTIEGLTEPISIIHTDDSYIYIGGLGYLYVYDINTLTLLHNVITTETVNRIISDNNYFYTIERTSTNAHYLRKYDVNNGNLVNELFIDTNSIRGLKIDDDYVYVGRYSSGNMRTYIYKKSDLTFYSNSIAHTGWLETIEVDDNYIYMGGGSIGELTITDKVSSTIFHMVFNHGARIFNIISNDGYLFITTNVGTGSTSIYLIDDIIENENATPLLTYSDVGYTYSDPTSVDNGNIYIRLGGELTQFQPNMTGGTTVIPPIVSLIPIITSMVVVIAVLSFIFIKPRD